MDGTGVYLEERTITLPHSGEVLLTIVRLRDVKTRSTDLLEHAVRVNEEYMGEPYYTNWIATFFDPAIARGAGVGHHYTYMGFNQIEDDDTLQYMPFHFAHEVAHYYWRNSSQDWIEEGPAEFLGHVSEHRRVGAPIRAKEYGSNPCPSVTTLAELEALNTMVAVDPEFECNYYLGERLFMDLYHTLGEETFRPRFRGLYLKLLRDDPADDCEGTDIGICHLEAAFKAGASDEVVAEVDEVINRWYYGTDPTSMSATSLADLRNGEYLEVVYPARANRIKALPWVADGVEDSEHEAAEALIEAAIWNPDTFNALIQMAWVVDDITADEARAIEFLRATAKDAPELAEPMLQSSWAQDDITRDEATVIEYLYRITRTENESLQPDVIESAINILAMPFLDTVESPDAMAVLDLYGIAYAAVSDFLNVMASPKMRDGITDDEAKVVAVLSSAYEYKPDSLPVLLAGLDGTGSVYLQERTIELPLAGEALLAIIRLHDQITPSMDYLELAVRYAEEFMGEPLPTNYVAWYFDDATATGGGHNSFTHIASNPRLDDVSSYWWQDTPGHIAHEVAHYYWRGGESWLYEGSAELVSFVSENVRIARPIETYREPCAYAANIAELEALETEVGDVAFICNYSLGGRFFLDLYHSLGEDAFRQRFRSLYLKSLRDDPTDGCEGIDIGICHLEAAFKTGASDEVVAEVDEIIDRWYYGAEPYDLSRLDDGPVDPSLSSINGRIAEAYITLDRDNWPPESRTNQFSASNIDEDAFVYLYLEFDFPRTAGPKILPLEYVEYYQDGFVFGRRTVNHEFNPEWISDWWRAPVGFWPSQRWAPGTYGVYVYDSNHKVAQVEYEVTR